jgi:hypothetical protein
MEQAAEIQQSTDHGHSLLDGGSIILTMLYAILVIISITAAITVIVGVSTIAYNIIRIIKELKNKKQPPSS